MKNKVKSCTLVPDYVKNKMTGNGGEVEGEEEECPQLVPVTSPPNSRQSCPFTFTSVLQIRDVYPGSRFKTIEEGRAASKSTH